MSLDMLTKSVQVSVLTVAVQVIFFAAVASILVHWQEYLPGSSSVVFFVSC